MQASVHQKRKVAIVSEVWNGFGYPYALDLAEFLARSGYTVSLVIPQSVKTRDANVGRGFEFEFVGSRLPFFRKSSNLTFIVGGLMTVLRSQIVIVISQPSLLLGLLAFLIGRKVVYYPMELILYGTSGGGRYSFLQMFLKYTSIKVATTGLHRSRLFARANRLASVPMTLPLTVMKQTSASVSYAKLPVAVALRQMAQSPDGIVVLCNGSLHAVNCLDMILEAAVPVRSGVIIGLIGQISPDWHARVDAAHAETGNYFYLGEVPGTRYDAMAAIAGADLGLVLKHMDANQTFNDQLYTPCKLGEFIAAGVPVLCSGQISLSFVEREDVGYRLPELTVETLREFLLSLPQRRRELQAKSASARAFYEAEYHCETSAQKLLGELA